MMPSAHEDPVRDRFRSENKKPNLDDVLRMFPRTTGEPAFDPEEIARRIEDLQTTPAVKTGHSLLDLSVKTGLAMIDLTFQGEHPKYGVKRYAGEEHDTFPPVIIAAVDALTLWRRSARAVALFRYWVVHFVREDGTIDYYGPSLSEYGMLLHTAWLLEKRAGTHGWWADCVGRLQSLVDYLLGLRKSAEQDDGLLIGSPEADERKKQRKFFHNNLWVARGLMEWASVCARLGAYSASVLRDIRRTAEALRDDTLRAIRSIWPKEPDDWWLPPQVEPLERPESLTATRDASYTNYRYWPEMLSSGLLPRDMAQRIVEARLRGGGQFCGMTRFMDWLDDWPLAEYLQGLWALGRKDDYLLSLYGHVAYHQAEGHLTAYEQVTLPPGTEKAPYCLPCQLVAARAARVLVKI